MADYSLNGSSVYQIDEFPVNFSNPVGVNRTFAVTGIRRGWLEIVFRNGLDVMDSWHLDGFGFCGGSGWWWSGGVLLVVARGVWVVIGCWSAAVIVLQGPDFVVVKLMGRCR
ncbi:hypothetical protein RHMOL_Rhmol06G0103700 [Rhododendron molle]|uniref:Uncharacterized protein n=1 Tax=Rhododendron molle TaxID=49168 RepID=A0ACC0NB33_RHOML|nr:hypothetical protein RHMOL_Rhmol06G0103700 [Rhododendron molle]